MNGSTIAFPPLFAYFYFALSALSSRASSGSSKPEDLCLSCGLCCNGAIFSDVKLKPADDAAKLQSLGLRILSPPAPHTSGTTSTRRKPARALKFCQPCSAFENGKCNIYEHRPSQCNSFECVQLKDLKKGATTRSQALGLIRTASRRLEKVRTLLQILGDNDEHLAMRTRFRRTARRLHQIGMDKATASLYGELTLATHDLNFILSDSFYPG